MPQQISPPREPPTVSPSQVAKREPISINDEGEKDSMGSNTLTASLIQDDV